MLQIMKGNFFGCKNKGTSSWTISFCKRHHICPLKLSKNAQPQGLAGRRIWRRW